LRKLLYKARVHSESPKRDAGGSGIGASLPKIATMVKPVGEKPNMKMQVTESLKRTQMFLNRRILASMTTPKPTNPKRETIKETIKAPVRLARSTEP